MPGPQVRYFSSRPRPPGNAWRRAPQRSAASSPAAATSIAARMWSSSPTQVVGSKPTDGSPWAPPAPPIAIRGLDQGAFPPSPILLIIDFLLRSSGRNENAMGRRRIRRDKRQYDQAKSRLDNGFLKAKEQLPPD